MTQPIEFTKGELFELGDAVSAALQALLNQQDTNFYEAKYGSASNLLSALKKITAVNLGLPAPDWMADLERQVAPCAALSATTRPPARRCARSSRAKPPCPKQGLCRMRRPARMASTTKNNPLAGAC